MGLNFNIAIDGHSSCGKSTIAKSIAEQYGMRYIDTGAMYRAVTLFFMRNDVIINKVINNNDILFSLQNMSIDFKFNLETKKSEMFLNNENVEDFIRGIEVSENVSIVAQIKEVRDKLIGLQRDIGKEKNVVMDGRDIGTKVFPNAKLKLFITASAEIRAERRCKELIDKGDNVSFEDVLANINKRDKHDTNRVINPLLKADDAILIDNTELSIKDQNLLIHNLIKAKLSK
ncbi:MAG: cytidylate kinase [Flavobacteriales bacterium]|nr:cytidylate kinase [Flavobacteriales bacterium]|tara:strand:- start:16166 stop:16858 length:693 start_codon:yes stop_codon:yes gene_type:complete